MSILTTWTPEKVAASDDPAKAFASYLQQTVGVPFPTIKDMIILRKKIIDFFALYPNANWHTMCRLAQWAKSRKRRPSRAFYLLDDYRKAWAAGYIPEINEDFLDPAVDEGITNALRVEERDSWRRRLSMASTAHEKETVWEEWQKSSPFVPA